jgi:hypothetical protein
MDGVAGFAFADIVIQLCDNPILLRVGTHVSHTHEARSISEPLLFQFPIPDTARKRTRELFQLWTFFLVFGPALTWPKMCFTQDPWLKEQMVKL